MFSEPNNLFDEGSDNDLIEILFPVGTTNHNSNESSEYLDRRTAVWAIGLGIAAILVNSSIGCSKVKASTGKLPVKGTVTHNGKPVGGALVLFNPTASGGRGASGVTKGNGTFTLSTSSADDGVAAGEYNVLITKTEVENPVTMQPFQIAEAERKGETIPHPTVTHLLPEKYSQVATSGLSATVGPDEKNVFSFDLVD